LNCPLHCSPSFPPWFLKQFQQASFLHLHTCVHIICTIFILLPFRHHLPLPPVPTSLSQNLFCPLVLWICRRKNIKDKTRSITFLLIWDKDSYKESFLVLFLCIYVLYIAPIDSPLPVLFTPP
jgi:hypothetical protein